jgi:aldehyde dehydrogenase (NAD+)
VKIINQIYIDGAFVEPHGEELFDLFNPATGQVIGQVRLGDVEDTRRAIAAAKRAFASFSQTTKEERIALLRRLHEAMAACESDLAEATIEEFGVPVSVAPLLVNSAKRFFLNAAETLESYSFTRRVGRADIAMQPLGVAGLITPWNGDAFFICSKLATAIAAGCTAVIKPSEMSAMQTQVVARALHQAGLPPGVFNIVNGRGEVVGAELVTNPDVAKLSFTGSTAVGKSILRNSAETVKRVTLELGGKSPTIVLDDADLVGAAELALNLGFMNSGQACVAGTRILVQHDQMDAFTQILKDSIGKFPVGDPREPGTRIGPMVSQRQWDRVQDYIRTGLAEGATILTGGAGKPDKLESGYFVKPTVFANVTNDMKIAREEIFGPVLTVLGYRNDEDAISIANDTAYGLHAYVLSPNIPRARALAGRLQSGRVMLNGWHDDPEAPLGGFKQSGVGRERGVMGLEAFLEPRAVFGG